MQRVYLDNAATTPISPGAIEVMQAAMRDLYGNPSSIHKEGREARAEIEGARKKVAQCIGASIGEVFFTSGGTESNNMALKNAVRDLGVRRMITSPVEHHCILHTVERLAQTDSVEVEYLRLDAHGRPEMEHLRELLANGQSKTLVSLMHANNEIGAMIDLDAVSECCREFGALFHSDTVQTIGAYPIDLSKTHINFLAGAAHKFHGPKGVGFIYINGDNIIQPYIDGGAQERNMRGGTENIYGILGLAKALEEACENMEERRRYVRGLRDYLAEALLNLYPGLKFNGDWRNQAHYKLLSASFPPSPKSDMLLLNLDIAGISVSGGSACSSGADAGSHVIDALESESDRQTIRFSLSHLNTKDEIDYALTQLKRILPVGEKV